MDTAAALHSTELLVAVPGSPPHATPACDPLECLTSLCRLLLLSGDLNLPPHFCQGLLPQQSSNSAEQGQETSGGDVVAGEAQSLLCLFCDNL
jgi:hypothetical protein